MSKPNRDLAALWDRIQAIHHIQDFTNGLSYDDYAKNLMVQRAVERELEILGEAARRLSPQFCQTHSDIDWSSIIGLRNILAHRYDEIRCDRIWNILTTQLSPLIHQLESVQPPLADDQSP